MKFIDFEKPGMPDVLYVSETDVPLINEKQILIKVKAAGVNRPDIIQREGNYPPPPGHSKILGLEVAGTVEKIGKNIKKFKLGEKVAALVNGGGYAEYCVADEELAFHFPGNLSFNEAACIPECFFTAWSNLVDRGDIKNKKKILIHGGTSGIGLAAIQICNLFKSEVFSTVGSDEKKQFLKKLNVKHSINYKKEDFFEEIKTNFGGVDLILDFIGGDYIKKNINLLNNDGRLINIGFQKGSITELNLIKIMLKRLIITGSTLRIRDNKFKAKVSKEIQKFILPLLENGKIKIFVDSVFNFEDVVNAHKRIDMGTHIGKIVLNLKDSL
jgi:NADPH2:quinone reductase